MPFDEAEEKNLLFKIKTRMMKKFFESQTTANGKRKSPLRGIALLLIGAFLGGVLVQTGSVWANDFGISYSQNSDQMNQQASNQQVSKGPKPLILVPKNKNALRSQPETNNIARSASENKMQERPFSFLSDFLHPGRGNTPLQKKKNSDVSNMSASAQQGTMTPMRQVPMPKAVSAEQMKPQQMKPQQNNVAQSLRQDGSVRTNVNKNDAVRSNMNPSAVMNSNVAARKSLSDGTMNEARENRKSDFGVIRPVADIVSRDKTTAFRSHQYSPAKGEQESSRITESSANRRVINSYARGSVGDTIEDLESPYAPVRKSKSMKIEVETDNLLLDSNFSVDELLVEEKTDKKVKDKAEVKERNQSAVISSEKTNDGDLSIKDSYAGGKKTFKSEDQETEENLVRQTEISGRFGQKSEPRKSVGNKLDAEKISKEASSERNGMRDVENHENDSRKVETENTSAERTSAERSERGDSAPSMKNPGSPLVSGNSGMVVNNDSVSENNTLKEGQIDSLSKQEVLLNNEKSDSMDLTGSIKNEHTGEMVLASRQSPVIDIRTIGPKRIIVGHESLYQIRVRNVSSVEARKLIVTTDIPASVEVVDAQTTIGNTNLLPVDTISQKQQNHWQIEALAPGSEEILSLTLIPKQRNNFNLDCRYDFEQSSFQADIEVQEAVLELQIEGRDAIEWGVEDKYRLRLRNTGNGDAENVRLLVSTGDNEQATQILNLIKAGEEKVMDLSVKTMLDKEIVLGAEASSGLGLTARVSKSVKILRGHLRLSAEAPELQFVNNKSDYVIRVKNDGTAALKSVDISAVLSEGSRFVSCTGSGQEISGRGQILWKIPVLAAGEEVVYQIVGQMVRSGMNRIDITAADKSGLSAVCGAMTRVDAIASLNMRIKAPNGPVAVGSSVYYDVTVVNNGTKAAENVNAGIMFAEGIKALEVEGGQGRIKSENTKVFFNPIRILSAGQSISWRIKAQPVERGSHKVVAVVESAADNIRLNNEEITYCYDRQAGAESVPAVRQVAKTSRPGQDLFGDAVENSAPAGQYPVATNKQGAFAPAMNPLPMTANAAPVMNSLPKTANAVPAMNPLPMTANAVPMLPAPVTVGSAPAVASVPPLNLSSSSASPNQWGSKAVTDSSAVTNQTSVELKPAAVVPAAAPASSLEKSETSLLKCGPIPYSDTETQKRY